MCPGWCGYEAHGHERRVHRAGLIHERQQGRGQVLVAIVGLGYDAHVEGCAREDLGVLDHDANQLNGGVVGAQVIIMALEGGGGGGQANEGKGGAQVIIKALEGWGGGGKHGQATLLQTPPARPTKPEGPHTPLARPTKPEDPKEVGRVQSEDTVRRCSLPIKEHFCCLLDSP